MNVLLSSVGRRAYMVKFFKEVVSPDGFVHVCNSDNMSVAFKYADRRVVSPLIYDKEYIPFLLKYCKENKIDMIISLFDMDLLVLARHKEDFEGIGTRVIVSEPSIIEVCNDKWATFEYLKKHGFNTPQTYLSLHDILSAVQTGELNYPIIVKPRFGCGSISVSTAYDEEDLRYLTKKANKEIEGNYLKYESSVTDKKVIYQECLKGQEYGADIINDLEGNVRSVIVRKKLAMRSGETDIAELVDEPVIKHTLTMLGNLTHHIANMDCDVFMIDGIPYILEMNARFGGGYPFSHMGGCNLPQAIVNWIEGKHVPVEMISSKVGVAGFKEIIITEA